MREEIKRVTTIPSVGETATRSILAETGTEMSRFVERPSTPRGDG